MNKGKSYLEVEVIEVHVFSIGFMFILVVNFGRSLIHVQCQDMQQRRLQTSIDDASSGTFDGIW